MLLAEPVALIFIGLGVIVLTVRLAYACFPARWCVQFPEVFSLG
jgi:hypothetical protein|tara:strand:- start:2435 stop:2566 length:132 start_codon:yes stop_codon:yes gene_type:complete